MSNFSNRFSFSLITLLLLLCVQFSSAQTFGEIRPKDNSPYSRLGLGDLVNQNFAAANGMGNIAAALHDPFHLNILNPASYGFLRSTAFEVGFYGEYANLKNQDASTTFWNGNLNYLAIGFPIKNSINKVLDRDESPWGWGMSFALTPYSRVNYDIETDLQVDTIQTANLFRGSGGTYKIQWGNAIRYKTLSVGVNAGFIFGKVTNSRLVLLENLETQHYYNDLTSAYSVNGFVWNAGVQYDILLNGKKTITTKEFVGKKITLGLFGNSATTINTNASQLFTRIPQPVSYTANIDTIAFANNIVQEGKLPSEFSFGLVYEKTNKFKLGANIHVANWSEYENPVQPDELMNNYKFSVGGEVIPDILSYNSYWKKIRYRFGAFYGTDPRSFQGEQLTDYGVTFGLGLPIILPRQQTSFVNFAVEAGQFGLPDGLHENYIRMTLGFTMNDNTWFFKRKFN